MPTREDEIKEKVKGSLENRLSSGFVPSLGRHKKGKVRDVHFSADGKRIIGVTSDRVSAFDSNLSEDIPFKGMILNAFSRWGMDLARDVMPVAMVDSPDPNVVVQDFYENLGFECVVRGYVWGSMAGAYEEGTSEFCGIKLSNELLRYQKLKEPLFTPTTKAEKGHDENVTVEQMAEVLSERFGPENGRKLAEQAKEKALALYNRHAQAADEKGLVFIDTKYEFGVRKTPEGGYELVLIDEAGTPDSSRFCDKEEYEKKWPEIRREMSKLSHKTVSELLKEMPGLKVTEMSKQYLRDVLVERAKREGKKQVTEITEEDVIETACRYIQLHERLIGEFDFGDSIVPVQQRVMSNLIRAGYTNGGAAVIMAGSDSDKPWMKEIYDACQKYGIAAAPRVMSAHKQPVKVAAAVDEYNTSIEPLVIFAVAGGTDALSGTAAWGSRWPVVSCPPKGSACVDSVVLNPPGSSNAYIARADNAARFAAQMFGVINPAYHQKIADANAAKVAKLEKADAACLAGTFFGS